MSHQSSPPQRAHRWFQDPWVQGLGTGLSALVPARSYPVWLRQTMMWVPAVGFGALVASPATWRFLAKSAQAQPGDDSPVDESTGSETQESAEPPPGALDTVDSRRSPLTRWLGRAGGGVAVGALVYGNMRLAFWLDGAIERGLRRLHVPAPRVVMALGAGAFAAGTARADARPGQGS